MSFVSPLFLWYFLPAMLVAVLVCPRAWRNGIIAVGSLIFYATKRENEKEEKRIQTRQIKFSKKI